MIKNSFMKIKISLLVFFSVFGLFFCCNANAEMISADNLYKMALQTGLRNCYDKYAKDVVSIYSLDSYEKFFNTSGDWNKTDGQDVWIPTHVGNDLWSSYGDPWKRDSNLSCEQLFKGYESGKQKASGLLQLFQFPQILSSNMETTWGYKLVGSGTPTTGETTPDGNKVKITITEGSDSSGANKQKITTTGEIICNGVPGGLVSDKSDKYNWILNCEGEINASYRNEKIYTVRATYSNGRKWRAVYWDGHSIDDDWRPVSCFSDEVCDSLDWGETNVNVEALQSAALNVHASDFSNKSVLEILNGDARNLQEGGDSLTYRFKKMTESVFKSIFANPSFEIKVEAVDDGSGGGSGGDGNTTNYEPIFDKKTAGEIFSYSLGFDESLPHSSTIINNDIRYNYYIWNSTAKYSLYYRYLLNMMNLWPGDIVINGCSESKPTSGYYFKNKINEWCDINIPGSLLNTEPGVTINIVNYTVSTAEDSMFQLGEGTFGEVLEWFKKESSYTGIPEGAYANGQVGDDGELDPVDPDPGGGGGSGSGDPCYTNSGSLGWIVCPVITWLGDTLNAVYEEAVEPMLQIKSELFSGKGGSKTEAAWEIFRNIANIMFVILFLMVIFSQLTGVGIDNYGIKKILPKLIVAAVLINLSYVICQLAVDISNIAGAGLNGLLSSQAGSMSGLSGNFTSGVWFKHVINGFLVLITGVGVATIITTVIDGGLMQLLLPLLMGFIVAFVAVIFFFALLGMRQAGVIIMVVVSPVAFACYMLPNTKKIFDKWLKIFEGLLLLYPICGLLVGGSTLASAILVSGSTDFFIWLIGLLLMVVPFFFIPTLLKGSFAALGSVGAKLSGFGRKFGKSLASRNDKTIRGSSAFKNSQELAAERRTRIRAGIDKNGNAKKVSRFGKFVRGGDRGMARARSQYLKDKDARNREDSLMGVGFDAAVIGQKKRADRDETDNYMMLVNENTRNGEDSDALDSMYEQYMRDGNKSGAVAVARIAGRRKDTAAKFMEKLTTGDAAVNYDQGVLSSVMKEVATGENSGMYRTSTPLGFEFAAHYNREAGKTDGNGNPISVDARYSAWRTPENVSRALNNYVTNTQELVGAKGSSLNEIGDLMGREDKNGNSIAPIMDPADIARVSTLATQAIENRDKPGASWDSTKAEQLCRISGKYNYNSATGEITLKPEYANAGGGVDGAATPGQDFQVRQPNPVVNGGAGGSTNFDVRNMENETLLDLATSPNVPIDDALRTAAEAEYSRRNPDYVRNKNGGNPTPPASS